MHCWLMMRIVAITFMASWLTSYGNDGTKEKPPSGDEIRVLINSLSSQDKKVRELSYHKLAKLDKTTVLPYLESSKDDQSLLVRDSLKKLISRINLDPNDQAPPLKFREDELVKGSTPLTKGEQKWLKGWMRAEMKRRIKQLEKERKSQKAEQKDNGSSEPNP